MTYRTIVADPPWQFDNGRHLPKTVKRDGSLALSVGPEDSYGRMSMDDLRAIKVPSAADAHLYLWTINAFMVEAHELARAWGFAVKTILTWTKTHHGDVDRVSMKTGYYFRGATEHALFCVKGSLRLQTTRGLPTGFLWPRTPHSVKPEAFYDLVEEASPGPRLEMFSRRARLGWDTWGNEALNHVEVSA